VLVVEDEPAIRRSIAGFLEDADYVVDQAADGPAALACMRAAVPDVVIVDLRLPTMSGTEFVQQMRTDRRIAAVPIIILSAAPGLAEVAEKLGARGALAKPFHMDVVDRVSRT
jgi:DNA-binding response OmpR family regulator